MEVVFYLYLEIDNVDGIFGKTEDIYLIFFVYMENYLF